MGVHAGDYRLGYRGDIEGLRAIAILLVIGAHAGVPWLGGGFVGVDVFFVLSGFLITGLLVQEITNTGRLNFADFYIRRLRRLLPALVVMLVGSALLASMLLSPAQQLLQASAGASATIWWSNVHFALAHLDYFSAGTETNIFLHTWSLGVEEQFYFVWPALVYVFLKGSPKKGIGRLSACMLLVIATSFAFCVIVTYRQPQLAFYMMPLRAWQFAIGALTWLHFRRREGEKDRSPSSSDRIVATSLSWIGLVALLGAGLLLRADLPYPSFYAAIPTFGAACVLASGGRPYSGAVTRWLSCRPMQSIGKISYAWYLWHWPLLLLGYALTGSDNAGYRAGYVAVSLIFAVLSYYLIEAPIRRQSWWLTHQRLAIYGALALMAIGTFGFLRWYGHAYRDTDGPAQQRFVMAQTDAPIIYGMDCDEWYHSDRLTPCAFGPDNASHTVVLVGDSVAGQWFPAVAALFVTQKWRLIVLTKSSCPMVDEPYFYARIGREYTECASWRNAALKEIDRLRPDVVLTSSLFANGFTRRQWVIGSASVMKRLSEAAAHVYVLRSTPALPFSAPDCLAQHAERPNWLKFGYVCTSAVEDPHADLVYSAIKQASSSFPNVQTLDMTDAICPNGICSATQNGVVVFRDSMHMTATYAGSLARELGQRLQESSVQTNSVTNTGDEQHAQNALNMR